MFWVGINLERGNLPGFQDFGDVIEQLGVLLVTPKVIYILTI
jgi:hypothetical protein